MKNNKSKYKISLQIETEFETSNPYSEKEMGYLVIYTLIQKNIEDLSAKIDNTANLNLSDKEDYIRELKEQKNILTAMINEDLSLSVTKVEEKKGSHLKVIK